jgi:D-3-phosphoglycerate dehydrogenase
LSDYKPASVAVLSRSFSRNAVLREELLARHPNVVFNDAGKTLGGQELIDFVRPHDAAIVALEKIDEAVLRALPQLRILAKYGVGLDNVDLAAAKKLGIKVGWTGGVNKRAVSELSVSLMIAGLRGVAHCYEEIKAGVWRQYTGRQLSHATVGLVGFGHVGQDLAGLLRAFGATTLAYDIRDLSAEAAALDVRLVGFGELLATSDVVSFHAPLTPATANMLDAPKIARMKRGAVVVNTARGGLIDEAALAAALKDGQISAAAFDVFASEPPGANGLLGVPGFLATSHIGGSALEAQLAMGRAAIEGLSSARDPEDFIPAWAK